VPVTSQSADLVLLADVLEHVPDPAPAVAEAARILRPGGQLYVHTINRTLWARLIAVDFAENVGLVPRGTHDPAWFVRPDELEAIARDHGLWPVRSQGERPDLLRTLRRWTVVLKPARTRAIGYGVLFAKGDR
jgi:2-polyprenyl-6-hydroxyphenyl methylase / 3-demethylubiquinone-9 3-methyltransferase